MPGAPVYTFNITYLHTAGASPETRLAEYGIKAISVEHAIVRLKQKLFEAGFDRRDIRIIDAQNMDIP